MEGEARLMARLRMAPYAELRPNETLCKEFTDAMAELGSDFAGDLNER
jgi:hypothetical protein